jgi:hypothetical protein
VSPKPSFLHPLHCSRGDLQDRMIEASVDSVAILLSSLLLFIHDQSVLE